MAGEACKQPSGQTATPSPHTAGSRIENDRATMTAACSAGRLVLPS
jgi:hypothetical protein